MNKGNGSLLETQKRNAYFGRFLIVVLFSIAFAYIESAVVVYLRAIFYPDGFTFPLKVFGVDGFGKNLLLTEIGREAATLVLILTGCWLFGSNRRQRFAYFLTIFALWDIFFYVWLKVLIDWPASIMDWDILFLMPAVWASPTLAPILISVLMLIIAVVILKLDAIGLSLKIGLFSWIGIIAAALLAMVDFCFAGLFIQQEDYNKYFSWPIFIIAFLAAATFFTLSTIKSITVGKNTNKSEFPIL